MSDRSFDIELFRKLEPSFKEADFVWLPDKNQFRKTTVNGFQNVIISVSTYDNERVIEVQLGVRSNLVEEMAQQFLTNYEAYKPDANTLIISIGGFKNDKYFRYKVKDLEELSACVASIEIFFKEHGFTFLERVSNIKVLDEIMNENPHKHNKYIYNQAHRCFKGIILAKVNDRHHLFGLIEIYRTYLLKTASDEALNNYERMVSYLLHFSSN